MSLEVPEKFEGLFEPYRFKVFYGGRDGAKSWTFADALLHIAARTTKRIVCAREFQNSIEDSVHHLLKKRIAHYRLPFTVDKYRIYNDKGSEFIFKGLSKQDGAALKSLEGADIVWVEEAQNVSAASWKNLIPTVRKDGSEIWVSFNPDVIDAPTYQRFVKKTPPNTLLVKVNYTDNPWPSEVLKDEREQMRVDAPDDYDNIWLGNPRAYAPGAYWREEFEALKAAGRIGDVPHDPNRPVYAWFDLSHSASGKGDPHSIWFVQDTDTGTFRMIDYWEGNNESLPKVVKDVLLGRGYRIGKVLLPHDGDNINSHTKKSDADLIRAFKLEVEVYERTSDVERDLNNVRLFLPKCSFDEVKCEQGLSALRNHRRAKDEKSGLWKYVHDWTSHGAAAFRGLAIEHHRMHVAPVIDITPRRKHVV